MIGKRELYGTLAKFAEGLQTLPDAELCAVASRDVDRAESFAKRWGVPTYYHDYQMCCQDSSVDVVYIATTHHNHVELSLLALQAGKAVLCEKPVALNAQQFERVIEAAKAQQCFFMEAMWTRFIPAMQALQRQLSAGVIGDISFIQADFGISREWSPEGRMMNPQLGGGALLDLGIYPITVASMLFNDQPTSVQGVMQPAPETGVDQLSAYLCQYSGGRVAQLMSSFRLRVPHQARIYGTEGRVVVDDFFHPHGFTIERDGAPAEVIDMPYSSTGYQYEAAEVERCLAAGKQQSELCPWSDTQAILATMDTLRQQWNFTYPGE